MNYFYSISLKNKIILYAILYSLLKVYSNETLETAYSCSGILYSSNDTIVLILKNQMMREEGERE
jgi:hypothetical protein